MSDCSFRRLADCWSIRSVRQYSSKAASQVKVAQVWFWFQLFSFLFPPLSVCVSVIRPTAPGVFETEPQCLQRPPRSFIFPSLVFPLPACLHRLRSDSFGKWLIVFSQEYFLFVFSLNQVLIYFCATAALPSSPNSHSCFPTKEKTSLFSRFHAVPSVWTDLCCSVFYIKNISSRFCWWMNLFSVVAHLRQEKKQQEKLWIMKILVRIMTRILIYYRILLNLLLYNLFSKLNYSLDFLSQDLDLTCPTSLTCCFVLFRVFSCFVPDFICFFLSWLNWASVVFLGGLTYENSKQSFAFRCIT